MKIKIKKVEEKEEGRKIKRERAKKKIKRR